jgi:hypothetical protein
MSYLIDCALIGLVNYSKQQAVIVDQCSYPWTTGDGRTPLQALQRFWDFLPPQRLQCWRVRVRKLSVVHG